MIRVQARPPAVRVRSRASLVVGGIWDARWAYGFILPAIVLFGAFRLLPIVQGLALSFYDATITKRTFVGVENFRQLSADEAFIRAIINTFFFVIAVVPIVAALSLFMAVILFSFDSRVQGFFRLAFYLPVVAGGVVLSLVWIWIFDPTAGLLNYLLSLVGVSGLLWLGSTELALPSLSVVVVSFGLGMPLILYLAALGAISPELYEAAEVDGASGPQAFWGITLPLLRPTTLFILVTQTIFVFQVVVVVLLLTHGGPANATQTIVFRIYETAFTFFKFGYASAMGVILMVVIAAVAFVQFRLLGREVGY